MRSTSAEHGVARGGVAAANWLQRATRIFHRQAIRWYGLQMGPQPRVYVIERVVRRVVAHGFMCGMRGPGCAM